jgi:hypothetical protein
VRWPEKEGHANPVELVCSVGERLFAFEHTGIEPFSSQIRIEVHNESLFDPIQERFDGTMPDGDYFELLVARFVQIDGYRCLSLIRASGVVKCQFALA